MTFQDEDEVVISGIGGKFSEADNVAILSQKLLAGESLLSQNVEKLTGGFYEELPDYHGIFHGDLGLFDNTFFGISTVVAASMDPLTCNILQRVFEAVIDAGINPSELKGTNTTVFSGTCHSDADLEWATDTRAGYGIMGRNRCMNSNRVSYWLDLKGTSLATDSGWTAGLSNLALGWEAIKNGNCDIAIVSTSGIHSHALIAMQFNDFGILCPDGKSKIYDDAANGCARSSAVVVFVLQRKRYARRHYATIGHIFTSFYGNHDEPVKKTTQENWESLFKEFYEKSKIDVNDVYYIEGNGSGLKDEDAHELNAIAEFFCKNRKTPLLVGSVKSSLGNTESASSFCGIVKAIVAFEKGIIPKNLNYATPNSLCTALVKGKLKVVDRNTPIPPNAWIAVNCQSYSGNYGHILLKPNLKSKVMKVDNIPRLILLADRTNDYMADLLEKVEGLPFDPEFVALLHEIHSKKVEKYLGRGYTILPKVTDKPIHEHQIYGQEKRPVWFIFSGMGSQWPKMGKRLMDLPLFRESIEKSHKILEAKGLNLIKIITEDDPNMFENILHSFVGIAAIQIALVDILRALKITPDGMIGHSVGELGCAYADECFTAEQMILAAYYRGRASTETSLIKGSMAAIGKGYKDIKDHLPEGIEVACHNSEDSCTLSGPVDLIHKFVDELKGQGVFARAVNVSNIAYHSRYIKPAAPKLLEYLKQVVTEPKLRSSKWISTSNPEDKWNTDTAKYCSAEYHTNNLLSSVLFEEGSKHIPKNAICIEIAPHGLLQAILKRSLGDEVTNISMTHRTAEDPLIFLLQSIGKMYMSGISPCIVNLYPKVEFPVSRGTHVLSQLVHWHEQKRVLVVTPMEKRIEYSLKSRLIDVSDDGVGYVINGQNVYPLSVLLYLVWDLFAKLYEKKTIECPVVFRNVRLDHPIDIHLSENDNATVQILTGSGNFEVMTDHLVLRGNLTILQDAKLNPEDLEITTPDLLKEDIYSDFKRNGCTIGQNFRNLTAASISEKVMLAEIPATIEWVQTMESLFQLQMLHAEKAPDYVNFPLSFESLEIASKLHDDFGKSKSDNSLTVTYDPITNIVKCGGMTLRGLKTVKIPKVKTSLQFETKKFLPLMNPPLENMLSFADFCFRIALDNFYAVKNVTEINILEIIEESQTSSVASYLQQLLHDYKVNIKTTISLTEGIVGEGNVEFAIGPLTSLQKCLNFVVDGGFILVRTNSIKNIPTGVNVIGKFSDESSGYLFLKKDYPKLENAEFIVGDGSIINLVGQLRALNYSQRKVFVVKENEPAEGIENFKKRLQAETTMPLRWIFILDQQAPSFDSKKMIYAEQLKKGLTMNVYKNGTWGFFYEYNFTESNLMNDVNLSLEAANDIRPSYISLNLNENLLKLQQVEYSGKINGNKIMGISRLIGHKKIIMDKNLTWEIPESWSLEDGASATLSYALAYYCLVIAGKTKPSENVLVTDGLSCIGQASISVALTIATRVFVTVADEKEAALIKKKFPQIKDNSITYHNNPDWDIEWKLKAKGTLATMVVNTLDNPLLLPVYNCLGKFSRLFHFGKQDAIKNTPLGSSVFLLSLAFYAVPLDVITEIKEEEKKILHELIENGIKKGIVKPLPRATYTFKEIQKLKSDVLSYQQRTKTLLQVDTIKPDPSYMKFDTRSSFIIFGDETNLWFDVAEWLIHRGVQRIIINRRDQTKRSRLYVRHISKQENVFICEQKSVSTVFQEAKKLGPISAVFYVSMSAAEDNKTLKEVNELYRDQKSHFIVLTKTKGFASELCTARNSLGFPSTNFIWNADEVLLSENLEFMSKLCGKDSMIQVSPTNKLSMSDYRLIDLVPASVEDICNLGASLQKKVRIVPLETMTGYKTADMREITPVIFITGLQNDPVKILQPLAANFLYPAAYVQIPDIKLSIPKMASFILPELIKFNKVNVFNIVGISWGTHLALELTKLLEEMDCVVGLILIQGPLYNAKDLVSTSLESDLLSLLEANSKNLNFNVQNEVVTDNSWEGQLNKALCILNLPDDKEKDFLKGATFIYNNIQALIDHDAGSFNLKGPLSVLMGGEQYFDDKVIWKLSKSIAIRRFPFSSQEVLTSNNLWSIIHGSAISVNMSKHTIHRCNWAELEDFIHQKRILKLGSDFKPISINLSKED